MLRHPAGLFGLGVSYYWSGAADATGVNPNVRKDGRLTLEGPGFTVATNVDIRRAAPVILGAIDQPGVVGAFNGG